MQVKICGLTDANNVQAITALKPDHIGFIMYEASARFALEKLSNSPQLQKLISDKAVAVTVNMPLEQLCTVVQKYGFKIVQLHGHETTDYCISLRKALPNISLLKAISIGSRIDNELINSYKEICDGYVFDTATKQFGGSGKAFNWGILQNQNIPKPYLVAGGIHADNATKVYELLKNEMNFAGLDANSALETSAGIKEIDKTKKLIEICHSHPTKAVLV